MKAFLVLSLVVLAAAAALAYGRTDEPLALVVAAQTSNVVDTEPITLFLSGGGLLVLAGALRRLST